MATIDSGLGWSCNSDYYCDDTTTVITTNSGYGYKIAAGGAIVANVVTSGGYNDGAIMSTVEDYAKTTGGDTRTNTYYNGSITYEGMTWYLYIQGSGITAKSNDFPTVQMAAGESVANPGYMPLTMQAILEAAGVQSTATTFKIPSIEYVKAFVEGVESETATRVNANKTSIGTLSNLTTTTKTDTVSAINEVNSAKQPKTMAAVITVDGVSQTTVESALGAINNYTTAKISDIYANLGIYGNDVYGLQVDYQNYIYTRLAGTVGKTAGTDFNSFAPWSGIKRCNLADDDTVNAYYGDVSYAEDGSNGQCMVEIPKFYYRVVPLKTEPIGDSVGGKHLRKANYYVSATKYEGFKTHPLFVKPDGTERDKAYISAYEGCIYDVSESAYILDDAQTADFTATTGDKLSSIANAKPCSGLAQSLTRANSEILATNRGTGWHCMDVKAASAVQLLFMIEYGTLNIQNAIGLGVVNKTDDGSTNMSEITGTTSNLGNSTGMASGTSGFVSVSYRGIENFYGNIWKFTEGLTLWGDGTLRGGQPYICDDYTFTENTKTGYTAVKSTVTNTPNYISAFGYDPNFDWLFLPSECVNADSNYPIGDCSYVTSNLNGFRFPRFGADWDYDVQAGAFYWDLNMGAGGHSRAVGVRLMYIS